MHWKDALQLALARLLVKEKVKTAEDLVNLHQIPGLYLCMSVYSLCSSFFYFFYFFIFSMK